MATMRLGLALRSRWRSSASRPMKPPGLSQPTTKDEPGLHGRVLLADVVAPVAIGLFDPGIVHGVHAGRAQAEGGAGLPDGVEHMGGKLRRHVEFPAKLADIADAARPHTGVADLDLPGAPEREGGVRQVLARQAFQQRARRGPISPSIGKPDVTSVATQWASSAMWRLSQAKSRIWEAPAVTTRNSVCDSRVTVRSASMPPRSFSHWV
jgi:hypothetical protein